MTGPAKWRYGSDGRLLLEVESRFIDPAVPHTGDVRSKEYILKDTQKHPAAHALDVFCAGR